MAKSIWLIETSRYDDDGYPYERFEPEDTGVYGSEKTAQEKVDRLNAEGVLDYQRYREKFKSDEDKRLAKYADDVAKVNVLRNNGFQNASYPNTSFGNRRTPRTFEDWRRFNTNTFRIVKFEIEEEK